MLQMHLILQIYLLGTFVFLAPMHFVLAKGLNFSARQIFIVKVSTLMFEILLVVVLTMWSLNVMLFIYYFCLMRLVL